MLLFIKVATHSFDAFNCKVNSHENEKTDAHFILCVQAFDYVSAPDII